MTGPVPALTVGLGPGHPISGFSPLVCTSQSVQCSPQGPSKRSYLEALLGLLSVPSCTNPRWGGPRQGLRPAQVEEED